MTSTNFNIGLTDTRNSSKVIKPPGGGHTDIFGIHGPEKATPSKKIYAPSSISSCFQMEEPKKTEEVPKVNGNGVVDENTAPAVENGNKENGNQEEAPASEKKDEVEAPKPKNRVPPGGYSSGFW